MRKSEFKEVVLEMLKAKGMEQVDILFKNKVNLQPQEAFVNRGLNPSPSVGVDTFFEKYEKEGGISNIVNLIYENLNRESNLTPDSAVHPKKFIPELINAERNKKMLKKAVHRLIGEDLALIYRGVVDESEDGTASFVINNDNISMIGMTEAELFKESFENLKPTVRTMSSVIAEIIGVEPEDECPFMDTDDSNVMMVVANTKNLYGASSILHPKVQAELSKKYPDGYYVLPSSVHEVIVVKKADDLEGLSGIVKDVNLNEVSPEDYLSDYVYEIKNGILTKAL